MQYASNQTSRIGNRAVNQDRGLIEADDQAVLLAVADGMGGHERGELAAEVFVSTLRRLFRERDVLASPGSFLEEAMREAHHAIIAVGRKQSPPVQPLTTAVACLITGDTAQWAHVGDSRLYLLRRGEVFFQTRDHTPLADMVDAGLLSERQAHHHPLRNQVSRCLGGTEAPPDATLGPTVFLQAGDVILLCSDGLWSPLDRDALLQLQATDNLADTLETLALTAEHYSFPQSDNVTAVALRWDGLGEPAATTHGDEAAETPTTANDPLDRAIADIEAALAEYEAEVYPGKSSSRRSKSV